MPSPTQVLAGRPRANRTHGRSGDDDGGLPDRPAAGPTHSGQDRHGTDADLRSAAARTGRPACQADAARRARRDRGRRGHPRRAPPGPPAIAGSPRAGPGSCSSGTGDYVALRERYGDHVVDGIAGETMLLDAPDGLAGGGLPADAVRDDAGRPAGAARRPGGRARASSSAGSACGRAPSPVVDDAVRQATLAISTAAPAATARSPPDLAPSRWATWSRSTGLAGRATVDASHGRSARDHRCTVRNSWPPTTRCWPAGPAAPSPST